ncbi:hypothetical protein VNI00_009300 [Paramarasmius palmivorus]|uniref:Uncharacterized protein n=1 Tax=Paramarasmius palmivorus TaxID=297713 RepID=A0AAW0CNM1_9AGAR
MSLATATTLGLSLRAARRLRWSSIRYVSTGIPSPDVTARKANAEPQTQTKPQRPSPKAQAAAKRAQMKDMDQELAAKEISKMHAMVQDDPYYDLWAQALPVMDLELPYRTALWQRSRYSSLGERLKQIITNRRNWIKNSFAKAMMWSNNSFPGIDLYDFSGIKYYLYTLPLEIVRSTRSGSWLEGLRTEAFESYCQVQKAIARNDTNLVGMYAAHKKPYHSDAKRLMAKNRNDCALIWNLHAPPNPKHVHASILSVRAAPTHLGPREPSGGRLTVQALVKIHTFQSLEIYDKHAKPLHESTENNLPVLTTSASNQRFIKQRTSAPTNEVTEYLIFEKKMYMPTMKWMVRERIYPQEGRVPI